jgi:hypothetical protein
MRTRYVALLVALLLAVLAVACGDGDGEEARTGGEGESVPVIVVGDGGNYDPELDPATFVDTITNPYLPFVAGARWVYEGTDEGEAERIEVTVLDERRQVMGISATVVRDTVTVDGELVEDTFDWYAQDAEGTVWYLGEDTKEYEDGEVVSTDGSFEAGVDGALPGIVMPAEPTVGHAYRQEYHPDVAVDLGEVIRVGERTTVAVGSFEDVVVTRDWNPLEPSVVEEKHYAPGVGLVYETHTRGGEAEVELVRYTPPPS